MKKVVYVLALLLVPALVLGAVVIISNQPLSTDSPRAYFLTGNALFQKGDLAGAAMNYEQATALDSSYKEALGNLAVSYNRLGLYAKAAGELKKLLELEPENPGYNYDYAVNVVLTIKEDNDGTIEEVEDALAHFRAAESLSPGYANAKENIAFLEDLQRQYYS